MKEIKSTKKISLIKKLLIKICRIFGYELIDQSNLDFPVSNKRYGDFISLPGKKSFTLGLGQTKITRKVKSLDIIIKTCTAVQLVSQSKKRIFDREKSEYTFRAIKSLYKSAVQLKSRYETIKVRFTIIDVNSPKKDLEKIRSFNKDNKFEDNYINIDISHAINNSNTLNKNNKEIENNMSTTMASIRESFNQAIKCDDLVYLVEDDYLHKTESLTEMVLTYEKFASIVDDEVFLLSTDYPYLYKKAEDTNILVGDSHHWRSVDESLLTFMTSKKMIMKHYDKLIEMATNESNPFEKNLHTIYKKEKCFSPIPSLSVHCANVNSVFGISPNIDLKKLWEENK